jgi:hypothetical protein
LFKHNYGQARSTLVARKAQPTFTEMWISTLTPHISGDARLLPWTASSTIVVIDNEYHRY